jgi:hypothetical protein
MRYRNTPTTVVEIHIITVFEVPEIAPIATTLSAPKKLDAWKDRRPDDRQPLRPNS